MAARRNNPERRFRLTELKTADSIDAQIDRRLERGVVIQANPVDLVLFDRHHRATFGVGCQRSSQVVPVRFDQQFNGKGGCGNRSNFRARDRCPRFVKRPFEFFRGFRRVGIG